MNPAELHLAINHLPVIGLPFAAALLAAGLARASEELSRAGLWALAAAGLSALPVYWSGRQVGDVALDWPGVDPATVDVHYHAAKLAMGAAVVVGVLALGVLLRRGVARKAAAAVLLAALAAAGLSARAAHLGGLIRHVELSAQGARGSR
jgi:hypothetical protein